MQTRPQEASIVLTFQNFSETSKNFSGSPSMFGSDSIWRASDLLTTCGHVRVLRADRRWCHRFAVFEGCNEDKYVRLDDPSPGCVNAAMVQNTYQAVYALNTGSAKARPIHHNIHQESSVVLPSCTFGSE